MRSWWRYKVSRSMASAKCAGRELVALGLEPLTRPRHSGSDQNPRRGRREQLSHVTSILLRGLLAREANDLRRRTAVESGDLVRVGFPNVE